MTAPGIIERKSPGFGLGGFGRRSSDHSRGVRMSGFVLGISYGILALSGAQQVRAQLAITEVMSVASSVNPETGLRRPDYWELTNWGTNDIDLHGYGFRDADPTRPLVRDPFTNLIIRAQESVVFFQPNAAVATPAQFRAWWGEAKLPADLQCRAYASPGLSGWDGDAVWLFDPLGHAVDSVQFGRGQPGRAFTYESETGLFGTLSLAGANGAFSADQANDAGSPGTTTGPVPLRVLQPPLDQTADAGSEVIFSVAAAGMPAPRHQWFVQGLPLAHGTGPVLTLSNVQSADSGAYLVRITNGLPQATSVVAYLTVNTNPLPPTIVSPPADATVFNRQTAVFTVAARGYPALRFQWESNGVDLAGAVGRTLTIGNVTESMSGTRYAVRVWNALGSAHASAWLTVSRRPDLRFTEVMALPAHEEQNRHFDWFEVTNYETNAVSLTGWRFADAPSFARAVTITNALVLQPGESAVFAERLDARLFAAWWGPDHLPGGLQIVTYAGLGLGAFGDTLFLWNAAATDPNDPVATVSWAAASPGVTFACEHWCDPEGYGCLDEATIASVLGLRGAFRAADGGDTGSPGYVTNPALRILSIGREALGELTLQCRVVPGRAYRLRRAHSLAPSAGAPLEPQTATNNVLSLRDSPPGDGSVWFYRAEEVESVTSGKAGGWK